MPLWRATMGLQEDVGVVGKRVAVLGRRVVPIGLGLEKFALKYVGRIRVFAALVHVRLGPPEPKSGRAQAVARNFFAERPFGHARALTLSNSRAVAADNR